ncbi:MAG: ATP-binding protein [Pseudomonadota bacterium]
MAYEPHAATRISQGTMLARLLATSVVCVGLIALALAVGTGGSGAEGSSSGGAPVIGGGVGDSWLRLKVRHLVIIAVIGGALAFVAVAVVLLLNAVRDARRFEREAAGEVQSLRADLAAAELVLHAEPTVVVSWEPSGSPGLFAHALDGVPRDVEALLRFASWLDEASTTQVRKRLDAMFRTGAPAAFTLRTRTGIALEASCRVFGERAFLRLREAAGERLRFAELQRQYEMLAVDTTHTRAVLDTLPMPVWFVDADGRITWANATYVDAVDASALAEVVDGQLELLERRDRQEVRARLKAAGETVRARVYMIVGGERRAFDLVAVPLEGTTALFASDVAALEAAQGELTRQSAANEGTLDRVSTAVAIFGADQRLAFFNEAYAKLWGLDPAFLKETPLDSEVLDHLRQAGLLPDTGNFRSWRSRLLDVYRTRQPMEDWWHLADGRSIHLRAEPRPDGGVAYLFDDVTERLALERGLNELINVQRETLDNLAEGVAVFAPDGRLRLFNPSFASIWRLADTDLARNPHIEAVIARCRELSPDVATWQSIHSAVATISDVREPINGQMRRSDESIIAWTCIPLPDSATLLTFIDITDQTRVERALIERTEALEQADRLKNDFVSHVSYELRTPMTNIIGFSQMLRSDGIGPLNVKQREYLGHILTSSNTLLAIIDDILDLATIDAGAMELSLARVMIAEMIEVAVQGVREKLDKDQIRLRVAIGAGTEIIVADPKRLRQVIYNLLTNAIGFSPNGATVHLATRREGEMIVFEVADTGVGIPVDKQEEIFERFVSNPSGTRHRGAGLGLSVVRSLVDLHGGTISLSSVPGEGTTMIVRIPARLKHDGQPELRQLPADAA